MYNTVLFDLDGTIINTTTGVMKAVEITLSQLNLCLSDPKLLSKFVGPPMQSSMMKYFDMTPKQALEAANQFRANYLKHSLFDAQLYPGALKLLSGLKTAGYRIAVATNKSHDNAIAILTHFGVAEYCDFMMGSDLTGKLKKADIVLACLDALNADKEDAVLVGDSDLDAEGAEHAGIDFIAVTYGFGFQNKADLDSFQHVTSCSNINELQQFFGI